MSNSKKSPIVVEDIQQADSTFRGRLHIGLTALGHHAEIVPRVSIRLYGVETNHTEGPISYDRIFRIGDKAEYDSYNLRYIGVIVSIGEKTVTVEADGKKTRLDLYDFSRRNRLLDLEAVKEHNRTTLEGV